MEDKNIIVESKEVTKDIIKRLNDRQRRLCLYDGYDNSKIAIDDELLDIINNYYKNKLRW